MRFVLRCTLILCLFDRVEMGTVGTSLYASQVDGANADGVSLSVLIFHLFSFRVIGCPQIRFTRHGRTERYSPLLKSACVFIQAFCILAFA